TCRQRNGASRAAGWRRGRADARTSLAFAALLLLLGPFFLLLLLEQFQLDLLLGDLLLSLEGLLPVLLELLLLLQLGELSFELFLADVVSSGLVQVVIDDDPLGLVVGHR